MNNLITVAVDGELLRRDDEMMFKDWMTKMRAAHKVPFGTAYELFALEAWNAAIAAEREACAKVCEDLCKYQEDDPGESFADAIRARSNV